MNYLAHYTYNHFVCGVPARPYFSVGVLLPDLWARFSRRQRIRWRHLRTAPLRDARDARLQAGLLNHVEIDRCFHGLPAFVDWQRELRIAVPAGDTHPLLHEFLAHISIELTLDRHLLLTQPEVAAHFFATLKQCDMHDVAARVGQLGAVETAGLGDILDRFMVRRFLYRYDTLAGLAEVVRVVLSFVRIAPPPAVLLDAMLAAAAERVVPEVIWAGLQQGTGTQTAAWHAVCCA